MSISPWRFDEVAQAPLWDEQAQTRSKPYAQIELCNYALCPELTGILSMEEDGYFFSRDALYMWEGSNGRYTPELKGVYSVYDAGENRVGEVLETYASSISRYWAMNFPAEWYDDNEGEVKQERRSSAHKLLLGTEEPKYRRVANTDWVNLRKQGSKDSPSLAKLNEGIEVRVLAQELGTVKGWVRVYCEEGTGYIWHSFLEPVVAPEKNH